MRALLLSFCLMLTALVAGAAPLTPDQIAAYVKPPLLLGEQIDETGVFSLIDVYGKPAGYVFETEPLAPLPGFSGAPVNLLVMLDASGSFIEVRLIEQNEPIFVSGLGVAPFEQFLEQYRGLNIATPMVVGTPYGNSGGGASALTYLDGVTKATASVRIAHETVLAASLAVARERMQGIATAPPRAPDPDHDEPLDWAALVAQGIASHHVVSNAQVQAGFEGTLWAGDDAQALADPQAPFVDLWILDLGPPAIARAVLSAQTLEELQQFQTLSPHDEPILLIETARHGLVGEDFVRNTAPDLISAEQGGLPVALRDADLFVELAPGLPEGRAMILRADRRLGFDPASDWDLTLQVQRAHGSFQPVIGARSFSFTHATPERFFLSETGPTALPPWQEALRGRAFDIGLLTIFLGLLIPALLLGQSRLAGLRAYVPLRLGVLAVTLGFVGWWAQGQLSVVTPLAVLRGALDGGSLAFLLYDPVSLLLWGAAVLGFLLWGRGLFCGWLCPYGAMQEFAHHLGRGLHLPRLPLPDVWDRRLKWVKYAVLVGLVAVVLLAPGGLETAAEVEPFKTAITTFFLREWCFALYAGAWIALSMVTFKGFCRYVCPLGALMAIGGLLRMRHWIPRRPECGSPCQLCRVRCNYRAIRPGGEIDYDECFQCLDCVTIHDSPNQCVPLILARRRTTQGRQNLL
ncbi:4Fe-4S binding protein [Ruegeria pomeroyi]|uniref:4Fe-4S binding protein n=1 Tax=Ruegeria pomeroyi TaxID=89184 RepID=UPI001F173A61|nr:4Fe-4S binding protein [Ruegeria pomeroyi]MCE8510788.1 4Fe-4S binding protein [Ruegeria pomeroyi]